MKLALCNEVIRELDFPRQCDFAAAVGYRGLEVAPFTLSDEPHLLPGSRIVELRRAAAAASVEVSGLHWLLVAPQGLSITSADEAVRERTRDVTRGLVKLCAELGGTYLVHGSPAQRQLAPGDEIAGRQRALDLFAAAAEAAEAAGVVYCIEPLPPALTNFINSVDEAAAIVEEIGSTALRAMLDCSAAATSESEDIPGLLSRHLNSGLIGHVHFNDPNRRGPGEGALAFAPILRTLATERYDGWIGVEPFVYEPDGPACAARAAGYVQGLIEALGSEL